MLVGGIQGIVFSVIVSCSKKYQIRSLFYLAALILCIALNNLQYFLLDSEIISVTQFFAIIYLPVATLSVVFYFFYVKFFLFPEAKISTLNRLLFLPFITFFLLTLFYKLMLAFGLLTVEIIAFFSKLIPIHEGFALAFSIFLLILIFRQIFIFEKTNKNAAKNRIVWLKFTAYISLCIMLLYGLSIFMDLKSEVNNSNFFYVLWICQSFVIYWLGHIGIYKFGIREEQKMIRTFSVEERCQVIGPVKNEHISNFEKFINQDKNYLNSELTLEVTSSQLGLSKSYLSRLIHAELNISYTDYINSLRIEEAKVMIRNPASERFTLIAIGLEVGFNSKSTFNNAFKKHSGYTPSEFKKNKKAV